jgi:NADPH-dependent curcumin reductase CurA
VTDAPSVPRNLTMIMTKRIRMEGYIALDHMDLEAEMVEQMTAWSAAGQMASAETIYEGIDKALDAFWGLFSGANIGRTMVKLS